jgi:nucleotide sugar dehydrogenase
VVGAVSESCYERALALLRHLGGQLERVSSPETAEMAKLYADTFGAVRVALAFEMADACRANGLNPIEVADAIGGEPAAFAASWTSPDLDGCAVGVDAHHLAQPLRGGGRPATITEEALRKLAARPRQVVWRAQELLVRSGRELAGAPILVVGASCRPGVVDIRHAPALEIIGRLLAEGADVDYHDPLVPDLQIGDEWISGVDPDPRRDASGFGPEDYALAIIVTLHPGHDYGWLRRVPEVLDCTYRTPGGLRRFVL